MIVEKLDKVGPADNRSSADKLRQLVQKRNSNKYLITKQIIYRERQKHRVGQDKGQILPSLSKIQNFIKYSTYHMFLENI